MGWGAPHQPAGVGDRTAHPPRVASEEDGAPVPPPGRAEHVVPSARSSSSSATTPGGEELLRACRRGGGRFCPLPREEASVCVGGGGRSGRWARCRRPRARGGACPWQRPGRSWRRPRSGCTTAVGETGGMVRTWLETVGGRYRVVVATRPGVSLRLPRLGLLWVHREAHPGHREDRAPYYRSPTWPWPEPARPGRRAPCRPQPLGGIGDDGEPAHALRGSALPERRSAARRLSSR